MNKKKYCILRNRLTSKIFPDSNIIQEWRKKLKNIIFSRPSEKIKLTYLNKQSLSNEHIN